MKASPVCFVCIWLLTHSTLSVADDWLTYNIPRETHKRGPVRLRSGDTRFDYYLSRETETRDSHVASEEYRNGVLVKRILLKLGKLHGVQKEFYLDGSRKSEKPYKDGSMEGVFKFWGKNGDLVGQYTVSGGTGGGVVYDSSGLVAREEHYKNGVKAGLLAEVEGDTIRIEHYQHGRIDMRVGFFKNNSEVATIQFFSTEYSLPVGPAIGFSEEGVVKEIYWYVERTDFATATPAEYASLAATKPTLPPYYKDVSAYKQLVPRDMQNLADRVRKAPRVKIPLEIDIDGKPKLGE
jgi:hypothetical protein